MWKPAGLISHDVSRCLHTVHGLREDEKFERNAACQYEKQGDDLGLHSAFYAHFLGTLQLK
jgi:hypothetical protein